MTQVIGIVDFDERHRATYCALVEIELGVIAQSAASAQELVDHLVDDTPTLVLAGNGTDEHTDALIHARWPCTRILSVAETRQKVDGLPGPIDAGRLIRLITDLGLKG